MADQARQIEPVEGDEFRPALAKLWIMLLFFLLMIPGGAYAAYCWWYQVPITGQMVLSAKAGVVGLLAVPMGLFLSLVMIALLLTAKRLVIGDECLQLQSGDRVTTHIPFRNVVATYVTGDGDAGIVGLKLHQSDDPRTVVPPGTKEAFEIQVLTYGKPPQQIQAVLEEHLKAFRAAQ